ncbi:MULTISPECIES: VOC family protein [unclassified Mesorhizobium]|uniref:VOC family protein n=1 Tax=unclassified Mesorhizobium TaxID=325217 RepID=UPI003336889E
MASPLAQRGREEARSSFSMPMICLYADDLPGTVKRVEQAGGKIVRPIYGFPGGRRFHFADPDGYELAVYTEDGSKE